MIVDVVALYQEVAHLCLDPEFLGEFAGQALLLRLTRFDLAARELPVAGELLAWSAAD